MKSLFFFFVTGLSLVSMQLRSAENTSTNVQKNEPSKKEILKISEAFGHFIGKNLESIGVELDVQAIVKGLKDSVAGKNSPMTEAECIQAITAAQESAFIKMAEKNKVAADAFLEKNRTVQGVVSCAEGKVQYKIEKEGSGDSLKEGDCPLIQYVGKFLDGSVFGSSKEPEPFSIDEVISGLKTGLLGMKEGEKRTIFIHPDYAYGTKGSLPPNSLLTFEIELVKANSPIATIDSAFPDANAEIALPDQPVENVR